jgi:hypothetical protein
MIGIRARFKGKQPGHQKRLYGDIFSYCSKQYEKEKERDKELS